MSILKIYKYPDDVLKKKSIEIDKVTDEIHSLAKDMFDTMYDAPGVGLAANQVGVLKRILVMDTSYNFLDDSNKEEVEKVPFIEKNGKKIVNSNPIVMINPKITKTGKKILFLEGCLSVENFRAEVERFETVSATYMTLDFEEKKIDSEGLLAIAIQHEIDHLDGKLFIEKLSQIKQEMVKKQLIKQRKIEESQDPKEIY